MNIEEILKKEISNYVSEKMDKEIEEKINKFRYELARRKDEYIAEVMKGIRIYQEQQMGSMQQNYVITFENIVRLEN